MPVKYAAYMGLKQMAFLNKQQKIQLTHEKFEGSGSEL